MNEQNFPFAGDHSPKPSIPFEFQIFSKKQLADYFQVSERTIENWVTKGYLEHTHIAGTIRFQMGQVLALLEKNSIKPRRLAPRSLRRRWSSIQEKLQLTKQAQSHLGPLE